MILRNFFLALGILGVSALVPESRADQAQPIYVVNMQRILTESVIGKAARNNLETEIKKSQGNLEKAKLEVDTMKEQLEKQSSLLSADAARDKQAALEKKEREFERLYQDQREELARKNDAAIGKVVEEIDKVIKEVAEKNKYPFILEKDERLVVYADKKFDLTDQIIKILDDKKVGL